jgi:hypothetical protein
MRSRGIMPILRKASAVCVSKSAKFRLLGRLQGMQGANEKSISTVER